MTAQTKLALLAALSLISTSVSAQQDTAKLEPVVVTVTRTQGRSILRSPFAITVTQPDSARPGQRHSSIDETIALVPGVVAVSRNNPAQDPRLSIRGFGARSAFGVRGVRVLRDGIPVTLPDGQTPLDYLSLESIGKFEILRGAASAMYGNASGGVVDLQSAAPAAAPIAIEGRQWIASNAASRSVIAASGTSSGFSYVGDLEHSRSDGSREHSRQRATSGFGRASLSAGATSVSLSILGLVNPLSQNPGALTLTEMRADRAQADAQSLRRDAKKAVRQIQLGLSSNTQAGSTTISLLAFGGSRSLDNPLTFGIVEVGRHSYGASASAKTSTRLFGADNSVNGGVDFQSQNDLRRNYATCIDTLPVTSPTASCPFPGEERGVVTLDQRERVSSLGFYVTDELALNDRVSATAGVRADNIRFRVEDRLVSAANPDDSGRRSLAAVSPVAGIIVRTGDTQSIYANISSAFETPTATELGNHADGSAGINPDLDPQRSTTIETGAKGWIGAAVRFDVSVYDTHVRDELVPFEIPDSNGRRYFRNAGRTRRRGAEAGVDVSGGPLALMLAYTWSHFRFEKYSVGNSDFSGNEIPGIPSQRLQMALRVTARPAYLVIENELAGRTFVDDANTLRAPGYLVTSLRAGASFGRQSRLAVVAGIQNIFDQVYASSIAVNAARGKFFEPAPGRSFLLGLSIGR